MQTQLQCPARVHAHIWAYSLGTRACIDVRSPFHNSLQRLPALHSTSLTKVDCAAAASGLQWRNNALRRQKIASPCKLTGSLLVMLVRDALVGTLRGRRRALRASRDRMDRVVPLRPIGTHWRRCCRGRRFSRGLSARRNRMDRVVPRAVGSGWRGCCRRHCLGSRLGARRDGMDRVVPLRRGRWRRCRWGGGCRSDCAGAASQCHCNDDGSDHDVHSCGDTSKMSLSSVTSRSSALRPVRPLCNHSIVAELTRASDSKSAALERGGSSPAFAPVLA